MKLLSHVFLIAALIFLAFSGYYIWLQHDPNRLAFKNYKEEQAHVSTSNKELPIRVSIKNLNINLPLLPANVIGNKWDVTSEGASYLLSSPIPGNEGNSIIYAHNWASLFGNLPKVKKGDIVEIEFADKSVKTFVIENTATVSPANGEILKPTNEKKITLYTCVGFLDSQRFVAVATLKNPLAKK